MKKIIIILVFASTLIASCKTKEVIRYVEIPKNIVKIDSVFTHSTDSFTEFQKGDTIFQLRYKTLYKNSVKIEHDTISKPYEVIVKVPVDKIIIKYKRDLIWWMGLCVGLISILFLAFKIIKR